MTARPDPLTVTQHQRLSDRTGEGSARASLAVAYHHPVKRLFVEQVMIPAARRVRAADGVRCVHLARHWRFGPHVQLVASGPGSMAVRAALIEEQGRLEKLLRAHGSDYKLDVPAYLAMSESLGAAELVPPPYQPVWPDNSVRLCEPALEPGLIANPRALDLRDQFAEALLSPLERILGQARANRFARLAGATSLMVLLAATYPDRGLIHGYLSFKSHLEDHLHDYDDGSLRADFQARYAPARDAFEALVADLVPDPTSPTGYAGTDPVLREWSDALSQCWQRALRLAEDRDILPLLHGGYIERAGVMNEHLDRKWAVGDDREYSEFHAALRAVQYTDPLGGRWFASYRFMVNVLYSQMLLLDVSPAERLFLAHAVSEAVQSVTGVGWREILAPQEVATP